MKTANFVDYSVIACYAGLMVLVGLYVARFNRGADLRDTVVLVQDRRQMPTAGADAPVGTGEIDRGRLDPHGSDDDVVLDNGRRHLMGDVGHEVVECGIGADLAADVERHRGQICRHALEIGRDGRHAAVITLFLLASARSPSHGETWTLETAEKHGKGTEKTRPDSVRREIGR